MTDPLTKARKALVDAEAADDMSWPVTVDGMHALMAALRTLTEHAEAQAQRITELEEWWKAEAADIAEQRDGWRARAEKAEGERDALAARIAGAREHLAYGGSPDLALLILKGADHD